MTEGLREYDDSIGRCIHCDKLVFKEEDWVIPHYAPLSVGKSFAHKDCEQENMRRASQIGIPL